MFFHFGKMADERVMWICVDKFFSLNPNVTLWIDRGLHGLWGKMNPLDPCY